MNHQLRPSGTISRIPRTASLLWFAGALSGAAPAAAEPPSEAAWERLEATVQTLTEEVRRLRDDTVSSTPATEGVRETPTGSGSAKVYSVESGLSLGGYGEFYFAGRTGRRDVSRQADFYRFVTFVGYRFSDRILMNTELEFEHATTESNLRGRTGEVSVEFSYLDFLISKPVNVRGGSLLVPIGFVNEMHEPPFYRGNFRPAVERAILPSTWRELGAGVHGEPIEGLRYSAYVVNGLDAAGYGTKGLRDGRQNGNRALWEDVAGILALDWQAARPVTVGGAVFSGGADQGRRFAGREVDVLTTIVEGHLELRHREFRGRFLAARTSIGDADAIAADLTAAARVDEPGHPPIAVPEEQIGWYAEGAIDTARWIGLPREQALLVWARFESLDLHHRMPGGTSPDPAFDTQATTVGLEYQPHGNVAVKLDWTAESRGDDGATEDPLRLGAGFTF